MCEMLLILFFAWALETFHLEFDAVLKGKKIIYAIHPLLRWAGARDKYVLYNISPHQNTSFSFAGSIHLAQTWVKALVKAVPARWACRHGNPGKDTEREGKEEEPHQPESTFHIQQQQSFSWLMQCDGLAQFTKPV